MTDKDNGSYFQLSIIIQIWSYQSNNAASQQKNGDIRSTEYYLFRLELYIFS